MYYVTRKEKLFYARYEKPLKNHPLQVAKKTIVETYSSSNAAAHDPEERVQLHKPRHYTIYKCKRKRKTSEEDDTKGRFTRCDLSARVLAAALKKIGPT